MDFSKVSEELKRAIKAIVGVGNVFDSPDRLHEVASDHTEDLKFVPELLIKPGSAEEIAEVLKLANAHQIPVTPRGGGTGVSGGALPVCGGIVLSLERLNKILSVDKINRCATVESGVITQVFQEHVAEYGLCFPPDPGSKGSCFLGGNLAESSGGPRSLKFGVTRTYVLNMEVVLPSGEIIWTGKNVTKNATGYDLTNLICGSEGTLGIITKIVFRLVTPPRHEVLMLLPFVHPKKVFTAVNAIAEKGFSPVCMEFIDERSVEIIEKYHQWPAHRSTTKSYLWIEMDGESETSVMDNSATLLQTLEQLGIDVSGAMIAQSREEKEHLWTLRKRVGESIITYTVFKDIDTVVPVSQLESLIAGLQEIEQKHHFRSACFGHIGNGNLHIQIMKESMTDTTWNTTIKTAVKELFELVNKLGGSLSGEHGVGYLQKEFLPVTTSEISIRLMREIKKAFDPNGILNPGKIFHP